MPLYAFEIALLLTEQGAVSIEVLKELLETKSKSVYRLVQTISLVLHF